MNVNITQINRNWIYMYMIYFIVYMYSTYHASVVLETN